MQLAASLAGVVSQRLVPQVDGGMVAAFEVLIANNAGPQPRSARARRTRSATSSRRAHDDGMQTLETSLSELVADGVVSYEEAVARSMFPKEIRQPADHAAFMARQLERQSAVVAL